MQSSVAVALLALAVILTGIASRSVDIDAAQRGTAPGRGSAQGQPRVDHLKFAQGAISVGGTAAQLGASFDEAMRIVDGDPRAFVLTSKPGSADTTLELVYELPAPTTFDRFAVTDVRETPSPSQTFVRNVEVHGSSTGSDTGFVRLASATLVTHASADQVTELTVHSRTTVKWVRLQLSGAIDAARPAMFLEFSEIIGNGTQSPMPLATGFTRAWKGRGVLLELKQDGAVVSGCYDADGELTGTVTGNVLRAVGSARGSGVKSAFILGVAPDGRLRGVRSTNGAPFTMYLGEPAPAGSVKCPSAAPTLGCGSVIHGINFDFDSAMIRPDSEPVLARLFDGLRPGTQAIVIEGHTSNEGADGYNADLSRRRAQAVVDDLARRGVAAARLSASGAGETRPIASNNDENGRAMNRRVEIRCKA